MQLAGVAADGAWGAKPKLCFSSGGEHSADGSPVSIGLYTNLYCSIRDEGTLEHAEMAHGLNSATIVQTRQSHACP